MDTPNPHPHRKPESDSQAEALVCQKQVRQCEQHMQFCSLFSSSLVPGLPITEQAFNHTKDVLHLCPDRRFFPFSAFDLTFGTRRIVLALGWTAIDPVFDFLSLFVVDNGILSLVGTKIARIAISDRSYRF